MVELFEKIGAAFRGKDNKALQVIATRTMDGETSVSPSRGCGLCDGGWIHLADDAGNKSVAICQCQKAKKARWNIEKSGLKDTLEECTFDRFEAVEPWQKDMMDKGKAYVDHVKNSGKDWFFIGGQVGSGKTHICTAICGELLNANVPVVYKKWPETARRLKACVNDNEQWERLMDDLRSPYVLYVDDFLKSANRGNSPTATDADITLAFNLFDARYTSGKPTIISCEWPMKDLLVMDEGVMSRIYQRSKNFCIGIGRDKGKNWRMRG